MYGASKLLALAALPTIVLAGIVFEGKSSCPCTNAETLVNTFLVADITQNLTAANAVPYCTFAKRYSNVWIPQGFASFQPGGDDLSVRASSLANPLNHDDPSQLNITIERQPKCTFAAQYVKPAINPTFTNRIRQVIEMTPVNGTDTCYVNQITDYVCRLTAAQLCPTVLGGPSGKPLPPPTPCKALADNRPCIAPSLI